MTKSAIIVRPEVEAICKMVLEDVQNLFTERPELWLVQEAGQSYKLAIILSPSAFYSETKRQFREKMIDICFRSGLDFFVDFMLLANKETLDRGLLKSDGFEFLGETP